MRWEMNERQKERLHRSSQDPLHFFTLSSFSMIKVLEYKINVIFF